MEYLNRARELGKAITETEAFKLLMQIEDEIAKIERVDGSYSEEEKSILNELIKQHKTAQDQFKEVMNDINLIISHYTKITVKKDDCLSCSKCK